MQRDAVALAVFGRVGDCEVDFFGADEVFLVWVCAFRDGRGLCVSAYADVV